jgi:hypothetical protein
MSNRCSPDIVNSGVSDVSISAENARGNTSPHIEAFRRSRPCCRRRTHDLYSREINACVRVHTPIPWPYPCCGVHTSLGAPPHGKIAGIGVCSSAKVVGGLSGGASPIARKLESGVGVVPNGSRQPQLHLSTRGRPRSAPPAAQNVSLRQAGSRPDTTAVRLTIPRAIVRPSPMLARRNAGRNGATSIAGADSKPARAPARRAASPPWAKRRDSIPGLVCLRAVRIAPNRSPSLNGGEAGTGSAWRMS